MSDEIDRRRHRGVDGALDARNTARDRAIAAHAVRCEILGARVGRGART
jgi:hypothetical protein